MDYPRRILPYVHEDIFAINLRNFSTPHVVRICFIMQNKNILSCSLDAPSIRDIVMRASLTCFEESRRDDNTALHSCRCPFLYLPCLQSLHHVTLAWGNAMQVIYDKCTPESPVNALQTYLVKESFGIMRPGNSRELDEAKFIGQAVGVRFKAFLLDLCQRFLR